MSPVRRLWYSAFRAMLRKRWTAFLFQRLPEVRQCLFCLFVVLLISEFLIYVFFGLSCRRVSTKCSLCLNVILPTDLVRHSRDSSVFHLKCFFCVVCHKQLSTGDEYCLLENFRPVCREDFQHIFKEMSNILPPSCKIDSNKIENDSIKEESLLTNSKEMIILSNNSTIGKNYYFCFKLFPY